ncbi:hypothetical protein PENSUB_3541 [Penicillium subrubescens]|uniref:Uncharacterized protein n=1 Tax=Penicillium subrubescens TaxID=1316194 RepID=A0A1Q5UEW6_9EURO|nr:hypothetical protein PENSUB_3541 [Penicillium subrubescens]
MAYGIRFAMYFGLAVLMGMAFLRFNTEQKYINAIHQRFRRRFGDDRIPQRSLDAYVFQGMMINEFQDRVYQCVKSAEDTYQCSYPSDLKSVGQIRGTDVLKMFSIDTGLEGTCFGSMIGIIVGYRLLASIVLVIRK